MTRNLKRCTSQGFTLIEVMIVVAIIALLAAVALPSYQSYIRKSRRSDAFIALSNIQLAQEKWRATHMAYGTLANLKLPSSTEKNYYTVSVTALDGSGVPTGTGYIASASATNPPQSADAGCTTLTVTVSGALSPSYYGAVVSGQPGVYYGPNATCWVR